MAQIDLKYATIKIQDGTTPTPNEIEVKIGEGNLTYTEARNIDYTLDRGLLDEVREGDEIPMAVTFDFIWDWITGNQDSSGVPPTVEDALKQQNNASSWVSTDSDDCRPYAVDIVVEYVPTCGTNPEQEVITLADFRWESLEHDLRAGTVACSGNCNVTKATVVRSAQP
jgi:hypothetical protein